jgi:membrane protease YdiL (CAAX protease family)
MFGYTAAMDLALPENEAFSFRRLGPAAWGTLRNHGEIAVRNRVALICLCATFAVVLWLGVYNETRQAIGYLFAVWLSAFFTDLVVLIRPEPAIGFPIKEPAAQEALVIVAFTALAFVPLSIRFSQLWPLPGMVERLTFVVALCFFTFFIGLACVYLLWYRYRPSQLGFNFHYWYLPLLIHSVFGVITLVVAPEKSHWRSFFHSYGVWGVVAVGIFQAALPEEFMRMMLQTRLGKVLGYPGLGFFAATFLWASLHVPMFWSQHPQWTFWRAVCAPWTIIPIGLLWGYMTRRTKSLLPAILVHGLNLWGLQNF